MKDLRILDAVAFAAAAHDGQTRDDAEKSPYIRHPIEVAQILYLAGVNDVNVLIAALLHDVVEDCGIGLDVIVKKYGDQVAAIVADVTDDPALNGDARKDAQIARAAIICPGAKLIKVADKIANVRDVINRPPVGWDLAKKAKYLDFAQKVVDAAGIDNQILLAQINDLLDGVVANG